MNRHYRPVRTLFLLFIIGLNLSGCLRTDDATGPAQAPKVIAVRTVPVVHTDFAPPIRAAGMVALKDTIKLSFKTGGIIETLNAEEGQAVEEGQILARIDLSEVQARTDKAESAFEKAVRDLERVKTLYADKVTTLEQLQNAETGLDIAESDLMMARFNLQHSTIVAPSRGKILKRNAEVGELVSPGMPIFIFASTDKNWIIRFGVIDRDVIRLTLGDPAEVSFDVFADEIYPAFVSEIAETADPMTGTFEVELSLNEKYGRRLVSGFIAKINVSPSRKERLALFPIVCLVDGDGGRGYVYAVDKSSSQAIRLAVQVRYIINDMVAVSVGLGSTNDIVSTGAAYLENGVLVDIAGSDPPVEWE